MSSALIAQALRVAAADLEPEDDVIEAIRQAVAFDDPFAQQVINALAAHLGHADGDHDEIRRWQAARTSGVVRTALGRAADEAEQAAG